MSEKPAVRSAIAAMSLDSDIFPPLQCGDDIHPAVLIHLLVLLLQTASLLLSRSSLCWVHVAGITNAISSECVSLNYNRRERKGEHKKNLS